MKFFSYCWSQSSVKKMSLVGLGESQSQGQEKASTTGLWTAGKAFKCSIHPALTTQVGIFLDTNNKQVFFTSWLRKPNVNSLHTNLCN